MQTRDDSYWPMLSKPEMILTGHWPAYTTQSRQWCFFKTASFTINNVFTTQITIKCRDLKGKDNGRYIDVHPQ